MIRTMTPQRIALGPVVLLTLAACAGDERVAPLGGDGGGGAAASPPAVVASGSGGAGPVDPPVTIREVYQRDPFGNVAESGNLLWDGDFEWQSAFADQYGWIEGQQYGLRRPVVGPECRSGLKCARIAPSGALVGLGMASATSDLYASAWVAPESGDCSRVEMLVVTQGLTSNGSETPVLPTADVPDAEGWCHFEGIAPQQDDKAYVVISTSGIGSQAVVDDVVLRRATPEEADATRARGARRIGAWVPPADLMMRVTEVRRVIDRLRGPNDRPPSPTQRALERSGRGEGRRVVKLASPARGAWRSP